MSLYQKHETLYYNVLYFVSFFFNTQGNLLTRIRMHTIRVMNDKISLLNAENIYLLSHGEPAFRRVGRVGG